MGSEGKLKNTIRGRPDEEAIKKRSPLKTDSLSTFRQKLTTDLMLHSLRHLFMCYLNLQVYTTQKSRPNYTCSSVPRVRHIVYWEPYVFVS